MIRASAVAAFALAQFYGSPAAAQSIPVRAGGNASSLVGVDFLLPLEIDMSQRSEKVKSFAVRIQWNTNALRVIRAVPGTFGGISIDGDSLDAGVARITGDNPVGVGGLFSALVVRAQPLVNDTTTIKISVEGLTAAQTLADLKPDAVASDRLYCPAIGRRGDADGDGAANSRDALIALSASVGLDVTAFDTLLLDVNGDGKVQAIDALVILSHGLGFDVSQFNVFTIVPGSCATSEALASFSLAPGDTTVLLGSQLDFTARATDASGATVAINDVFWRVSDQGVASVTPDGLVATLDTGTTVVTAFRSGTSDSAQATLTVVRPKVLILSGGNTNTNGVVQKEFGQRMPGLAFDTMFANVQTPTLAFLKTFRAVLLYEDGLFANATNVGDSVHAYVQGGGNLIIGTFYWQDRSDNVPFTPASWGALEAIDPFLGPTGSEYNPDSLDAASLVAHELTAGLTTLNVHSYHGGVVAKGGTSVVASWSDGVPLIGHLTEAGGQRIVAVSTYPGYDFYGNFSGDFHLMWANAFRWVVGGSVPSAASQSAARIAGAGQGVLRSVPAEGVGLLEPARGGGQADSRN